MFGLYMFIFVDTLYKYKFGFYQTVSGNATNFLHFDILQTCQTYLLLLRRLFLLYILGFSNEKTISPAFVVFCFFFYFVIYKHFFFNCLIQKMERPRLW